MQSYVTSKRKGFTLIELLIAVSLVGVTILAIVGVDLAARRFVNTADFTARAQNDISPALEHMVKEISKGVGNSINNPIGGYDDNRGIRIWVGNDDPAINPGQRDHMIAYRHEGTNLRYCNNAPFDINLAVPGNIANTTCSSGWEELANKLLFTTNPSGGVDSDPPPDPLWGLIILWPGGSPPSNSLVDITLRARQNPAAAASSDNPQAELTTTVAMRGVTSGP